MSVSPQLAPARRNWVGFGEVAHPVSFTIFCPVCNHTGVRMGFPCDVCAGSAVLVVRP